MGRIYLRFNSEPLEVPHIAASKLHKRGFDSQGFQVVALAEIDRAQVIRDDVYRVKVRRALKAQVL